jgi:ubiquinone/menaquinone biosynthesis C-methylase UbiE
MRTDYPVHDQQYRKRKAEGWPGWDTAEVIRENLATFREMMRTEGVPRSGVLLELGCGAGDLTLAMAEDGFEAHGVDIAPTAISWAQEKAGQRGLRADLRVGDVLTLTDYADETFDVVLDGHCFHCIIGEDRLRFLESARRVLKPTGVLVIATMCDGPSSPGLRAYFDAETRCEVHGDVAYRYIGFAQAILQEAVQAGFQIVTWERRPPRDTDGEAELLVIARRNAPCAA